MAFLQRMLTPVGWSPCVTPCAVWVPSSRGLRQTGRRHWGILIVLGILLTSSVASGASYNLLGRSSAIRTQAFTIQTESATTLAVAAGFGYQAAGTSTILIKTYDPITGAVLTEDSYDLDVREEGTTTSTSARERIFAGGIGVGTDGLSQFLLRVYDAATGKFLWEGQLNLNPGGREGAASRVATVGRPRATVKRVSIPEPSSVRPYFLVRARDSSSGTLIWQDQFAAEGRGMARIERIAYGQGWTVAPMPGLHHAFDFMILAYNGTGEELLWQDAFDPLREVGKSVQQEEEQAHIIPLWPRQDENSSSQELIRDLPLR